MVGIQAGCAMLGRRGLSQEAGADNVSREGPWSSDHLMLVRIFPFFLFRFPCFCVFEKRKCGGLRCALETYREGAGGGKMKVECVQDCYSGFRVERGCPRLRRPRCRWKGGVGFRDTSEVELASCER